MRPSLTLHAKRNTCVTSHASFRVPSARLLCGIGRSRRPENLEAGVAVPLPAIAVCMRAHNNVERHKERHAKTEHVGARWGSTSWRPPPDRRKGVPKTAPKEGRRGGAAANLADLGLTELGCGGQPVQPVLFDVVDRSPRSRGDPALRNLSALPKGGKQTATTARHQGARVRAWRSGLGVWQTWCRKRRMRLTVVVSRVFVQRRLP